jgi:hypothetical protein
MIDEVLKYAIESDKTEDGLETPQLWSPEPLAPDITTSVE